MYYSEENNHSNHLFHSMIQLARGLGVSNANHSMMNVNPDTVSHSQTISNYPSIHSIPWSSSSELETEHSKRKHIGNSLNLLNQIPLDPTFNEVGRYLTNHVEIHSDFTLAQTGQTTHSDDSALLPFTNNRSAQYSSVKFPMQTDSYTDLVGTCQSLTNSKYSDYEELNTNCFGKLLTSTNRNENRDELVKDIGKPTAGNNDFNLTFPSMYTFRHRAYLDTDTSNSNSVCTSVDGTNPDHNIPTIASKPTGIHTNTLSQYYSNFSVTNTTATNTHTNNITENTSLNNDYDQKPFYHPTKNVNPNIVNKSEHNLVMSNQNQLSDSQYLVTNESPQKGSTIKLWSQESPDDNKLNSFCHVWNQESMDSMIPTNNEPETHSLVTFAELFKHKRIKLGATQAEVGRALGDLNYGGFGCLSQSTICRFESLSLSQNNMLALKPILQAWLEQAEKRLSNSHTRYDSCDQLDESELRHSQSGSTKVDLEDETNSMFDYTFERKRKRTSITGPEKRSLEAYFAIQPRPSSDQLKLISVKLKLPKSVVRVWFCNQRQKQKRLQTVNHTYNGTSVMNVTNDVLCNLCKTPTATSCSSPSYHMVHSQWNMREK